MGFDPRYIEIDGNVTPGDGTCRGTPCIDWLTKQNDGTLAGIIDGIGNNDGNILSPGSTLSAGSMLPKQDITRVWLSNNTEYFYLAEERRSNNGSSAYHLFMTHTPPTAIMGQPVVFHLENGDLEIQICFPKGSDPGGASVEVRQVSGLTSVLDVYAENIWSSGAFKPTGLSVPFAINMAPVTALAGALDSKGRVTPLYDTACFAEAAIPLEGIGVPPCAALAYATVITRSSCSLTSDLKDIAGPVEYSYGGPELTLDALVTSCTPLTTLSATTSGGMPPYTFGWYDNGSTTPFHVATITDPPYTDTFDAALAFGVHTVRAVVTDSSGCCDQVDTVEFTVYEPLELTLSKPVTPDCSNTATLSATADKALPPYRFQWYDNVTQIRDVTKPGPGPVTDEFNYAFQTSGDHTVSVYVTDARLDLNCSADDSCGPFPVYDLLDVILSHSDPTCDGVVTWTATASGGLVQYTYEWRLDGVVVNGNSPTYQYGPSADCKTHEISVTVTDSRTCTDSDKQKISQAVTTIFPTP